MVKLTMIGRVIDGLPLAQASPHSDEENTNSLFYKQHAELILKEISSGALTPSKMSIRIDHHFFHYLIENGFCYMTLCDSSYPQKLAFYYLQDLQKELQKVDPALLQTISRPYAFAKFDFVIESIRKKYLDTRTQANLSKLNADRGKTADIITQEIYNIIRKEKKSEIIDSDQSLLPNSTPKSPIWTSEFLEAIATMLVGPRALSMHLLHLQQLLIEPEEGVKTT